VIAPAADMAARPNASCVHIRLGEHLRERFFGCMNVHWGQRYVDLGGSPISSGVGLPCLIVHDLDMRSAVGGRRALCSPLAQWRGS